MQKKREIYLQFFVLDLTVTEPLLKTRELDNAKPSGRLLSEDESCWKQQVDNWKVYLQIWNVL